MAPPVAHANGEAQALHRWRDTITIVVGLVGIAGTVSAIGGTVLWWALIKPNEMSVRRLEDRDVEFVKELAELRAERERKTEQVKQEMRDTVKSHNDQPAHPQAQAHLQQIDAEIIGIDARIRRLEDTADYLSRHCPKGAHYSVAP